MRKKVGHTHLAILSIAVGGFLAFSQAGTAVDITINDGQHKAYFGGSSGTDTRFGVLEDGSVMAGCIASQTWDMEAFVVRPGKLILIGGFDMKNGVPDSGWGVGQWSAGDVFLNTAAPIPGKVTFNGGNGFNTYNNNGWNYALHVNWGSPTPTFDVDRLTGNSLLLSGYFRQNDGANPYALKDLADGTTVRTGIPVGYEANLSDLDVLNEYGVALKGDSHNVAAFDMSWFNQEVGANADLLTHFSISCNNDDVLGQMSGGFDVPEAGSTLMLLGLAISGLGIIRRRLA
jgi:hypothetical protein